MKSIENKHIYSFGILYCMTIYKLNNNNSAKLTVSEN